MTFEAWFSIATVVAIIAALASNRVSAETAMLGGLVLQIVVGTVSLEAALAGFAHPAVLMIGALFVVAAGLTETGATEMIAQRVLGKPESITSAQLRLMGPVALLSGFMNNTPIVAMYLPIVSDWARKIRVSPSKLYMPLSFAAILGGQLTLIGSASNLVVMGLYLENASLSPAKQFWGPALLGLPATVVGIVAVMLLSHKLLPERRPARAAILDSRKYTVAMQIERNSPIVGKSIEDAGLRQLPGLYLAEIERGDHLIPAPPPSWILSGGDILSFAGILESVVDLRKIRGLVPATDQVHKVTAKSGSGDEDSGALVEAVVSHNSPLVGRTVRATRFRTTYNAAIIAVHRNGEQVRAKVGDIGLQPGDTLLLETHGGFVENYRNSGDFYLVSAVQGASKIRHDKAWFALAVMACLIIGLAFSSLPPVAVGISCAVAMTLLGCVSAARARSSVNLQVVIVIASALGIGQALTETGAAQAIATNFLAFGEMFAFGPRAMLFVTLLLASGFAQLITNTGAAALMFPIAMATAKEMGVSAEPFMFTLMLGCGLSFITPIAYQTNLMVYGPGGYRFSDFPRMGIPLTVLMAVLASIVAPLVFSLD